MSEDGFLDQLPPRYRHPDKVKMREFTHKLGGAVEKLAAQQLAALDEIRNLTPTRPAKTQPVVT